MKTRLYSLLLLAFTCAYPALASTIDVFVGTSADGIYHTELNRKKGKLREPRLVAPIQAPGFLAMHPQQATLYAIGALEGEAVVAGYRIGEQGQLERFTVMPTGAGKGAHIAVHPSGTLLLTAHYREGKTALFPLDAEGQLGEPTAYAHGPGSKVSKRHEKPHPHWVGFSPDGRFAFVPDLGMDGIVVYRVDLEARTLTKHGFLAADPGDGPRHMRFSTDGQRIYLLNELTLSVQTFAYDAEEGTATKLEKVAALEEATKGKETFNSAAEILVHPNGRYLYSSNRGHDSVSVYQLDAASGLPTLVEVEPIRGAWPRNINLEPSGAWLLAAGAHSNTITPFRIDPESGELEYARKSIVNVPGPMCLLFREQ